MANADTIPEAEPVPSVAAWGASPVSTVMARQIQCVPEEMSLTALSELFVASNISAAPVVSGTGRLVGLVSKSDVVRHVAQAAPGELVAVDVGAIMTPLVFAVAPETPLSRVAELMAYESVHHIVIQAEGGEPRGIVSSLDFLRMFSEFCPKSLDSRGAEWAGLPTEETRK